MMVGLPSAPISARTVLTAAICSGRLRMADIHHVQEQFGLHHLLQRRLEGLHQAVGQLADETDRVRQEYVLVGRQPQPPRGRVQRGEKLVLRQRGGAGQGVEQGGFAGVGVADDRGQRPEAGAGVRCAGWRAGGARPAGPR